jgi:hypothetical protein
MGVKISLSSKERTDIESDKDSNRCKRLEVTGD